MKIGSMMLVNAKMPISTRGGFNCALVILCFLGQEVLAQPENRINISLGLAYTVTQDLMASRLVSRGVNGPFRIGYESSDSSRQHYATGSLVSGKVSSSSGFNSLLRQYFLNYGYNRRAFRLGNWQGYLGGEWSNGYVRRETTGINQNAFVNAFTAIRACVRGVVNLRNAQQLQLAVGLPLIGFTARAGFANTPPDNVIGQDTDQPLLSLALKAGQWSGPGQFGYSTFSFQYSKGFHRALSVRWIYTLSALWYNYPEHSQRMSLLNNQVAVGLSYWFNHPKIADEKK